MLIDFAQATAALGIESRSGELFHGEVESRLESDLKDEVIRDYNFNFSHGVIKQFF